MPTGPYGTYERQSAGDVLNSLCNNEKIPLSRVENMRIGSGKIHESIMGKETVVGEYKYFDGIEQPLFRWNHENTSRFREHRMVVDTEGQVFPMFRLSFSIQTSPGLVIEGKQATPDLHEFIRHQMLTQWIDQPGYKLTKNSGAFFQGGSHDPDGKYIFIEFWIPKGAQAWIDHLNENYRPTKDSTTDEVISPTVV